MRISLASISALLIASVSAVPSPSSLDSSLTFLYQNDLNFTSATQHSGAILLEPRSNTEAITSCSTLGETLLTTNGTFFRSDITSLLSYVSFQGRFPLTQEYWVSSTSRTCQTVTIGGFALTSSCNRVLPALCSQSAPFRNSFNQDKSARFQLTVNSQGVNFTGYRDHLTFRFLGLRYANTPQRWTYPTLFSGTQKAFDATQFGSQCVQTGGGGSEDCLFLNIWTPFIPNRVSKAQLKPVMLHIHGGAFTSGSANDNTFDGGNMASRGDVVIVDINYRLSTIGFLALNDGITNGNFGIADQITALDWVKQHISAFGGDPDRITIFGQSAGAGAVRALLGSPKAIGKFAAAIPMSNLAGENFATTFSLYDTIQQEVTAAANPIIQAVGCSNQPNNAATLACLRAVDAQILVNLPVVARFVVIDGTFVTNKQLAVDGSSPVAHVPVVMGFMRDDGAAFIGFPSNSNLSQGISQVLSSPSAPQVVASGLFPEPNKSNATLNVFNVTARITTDVEFRCLDQAAAITAVRHKVFPQVWFYQWMRSYQTPGFDPNAPVCDAPITTTHPFGDPTQEYFKCHSGELFYVWGNLFQAGLPYRDANDLTISQFALDVWTAFGRSHDPNPSVEFLTARGYTSTLQQVLRDGPWTPLSANKPTLRLLNIPASQAPFEDEKQCTFLGLPFNFFEPNP